MRTREEQISALACCLYGQDMTANRETAERMVQEAEQRVRAQIARDSERLDWLSEGRRGLASHAGMGTYVVTETGETFVNEDIRVAIDTARESNND